MYIGKQDNHMLPTGSRAVPQEQRLIGLDILRILVAFGVVLIHGLAGISKDAGAETFAQFFGVSSVPTFLIMAFYFSIPKLYSHPRNKFLAERFSRLLIPFYCWTVIYLVARLSRQIIFRNDSFSKIINNPFSLLLGSASVQLYFLPMLFCGLVTAAILLRFRQVHRTPVLVALLACSLGVDTLVREGENFSALVASNLDKATIVGQLAHLVVTCLLWIERCFPYILTVLLIKQQKLDQLMLCGGGKLCLAMLTITVGMIGIIVLGNWQISESIVACMVLLTGISASPLLHQHLSGKVKRVVMECSRLTFGIYLIHSLFSEGLYPLLRKAHILTPMHAISLQELLLVAFLIFLLSFLGTYLISRNNFLSKLLLSS